MPKAASPKKDPLQDRTRAEQKETKRQNSRDPDRPINRMMPYLLCVLAAIFLICLLIPDKASMGVFGVWTTRILYLVFGRACILLPVLLVNLALFWRKDRAGGQLLWKSIVSLSVLVVISALTQLEYQDPIVEKSLLEWAKQERGAGAVGSVCGSFMLKFLGELGTRLVSVLLLVVLIPFLFSTTPWQVGAFCYRYLKAAWDKRQPPTEKQPQSEQRPQKPTEPTPPCAEPTVPPEVLQRIANQQNSQNVHSPQGIDIPISGDAPAQQATQQPSQNATDYFSRNRFAPTTASDVPAHLRKSANTPTARYGADGVANATATDAQQVQPPKQKRVVAPSAAPYTENPASDVPDIHARTGKVSVPKMEPLATRQTNNWVEVKSRDQFAPSAGTFLSDDVPRADTISHIRTVQLPPYQGQSMLQTQRTVVETQSSVPSHSAAQESAPTVVPPAQVQEMPTVAASAPTQQSVPTEQASPAPTSSAAQPSEQEDLATIMRQMLPPEMMEEIIGTSAQSTPTVQNVAPSHTVAEPPKAPTPQRSEIEQAMFGSAVQQPSQPQKEYFDRPTPAVKQEPKETAPAVPTVIPYEFPPTSLLQYYLSANEENLAEELDQSAQRLVKALNNFRVGVQVTDISRGPTITRYEILPDEGVRVSAISRLSDDIALALAAPSIRIEAPIPGKMAVGVEVPNRAVSTVALRDLLEHEQFTSSKEPLLCALGMDVAGAPIFLNIAKMPHLLIAGATGMGKSVCINCIIVSLLARCSPNDVKLMLIDPKKVEFSPYNGIPHLLIPAVTDPRKAAGALRWATVEMDRRYLLLEENRVQNLDEYNLLRKSNPSMEKLPLIVIIIDELADLMQTASDDVEGAIGRLTQLARAAGIHLVIGTQRPSVDVITGKIKNNIPSRIAFTVSSQVDSRTILDASGAEKLVGRGDMLYSPTGMLKPIRVQGAFISNSERQKIVSFVQSHSVAAYDSGVIESIDRAAEELDRSHKRDMPVPDTEGADISEDEVSMLKECASIAMEEGKISASFLQMKLKIGFQKAKRMICYLEQLGIVGEADGQKPREVTLTQAEYQELLMNDEVWSSVRI